MGFFSFLFKKKQGDDTKVSASPIINSNNTAPAPAVSPVSNSSKKGMADVNGLYPTELLMLFIAEKFYVNGDKFPAYLRNNYQIGYPKEVLVHLYNGGFIRKPDVSESLLKLKVSELQDIATKYGVEVSGKKANMVSILVDKVDDKVLRAFVPDSKWILTDKGKEAIKKNAYIDENGKEVIPTEPNSYKFEAFIFDSFELFDDIAILRGKREDDFAPVKNKEGVDSPKTAKELYEKYWERN